MKSGLLPTLRRSALYTTLVTWGAVSVARQFSLEGHPTLVRMDPYGLFIPNYHFFCPEPARHDLNLLYRDQYADGETGPWQEIVTTRRRQLLHMVWYPHRRFDKGMMDVANELIRFAKTLGDVDRLSLTRPYMSVLNLVTYGVSHDSRTVRTQFALGYSAAYEPDVEPSIVFVSNIHDVPQGALSTRPLLEDAAA